MEDRTTEQSGQRLKGVIAVVGCDGSGKSTLTADLLAHLQAHHPTEYVYLGQSSGNIGIWIEGLPLIGAPLGRYLKRRSTRAHAAEDKPASPDTLTAIVIYVLTRWRLHKFRKMLRLSRSGIWIVTDRYPQAEVPGFYFDGPGLSDQTAASPFVRWLARREMRLYRQMASQVPSLLIRLNIDAETAHARKPDHKLKMLSEKARVIPTLRFNGATILDLDATRPYAQVKATALASACVALGASADARTPS